MTRRKSKKKAVIITLVIITFICALAVAVKLAYDYCYKQYLLATHPMKYTSSVSAYSGEFEVPEMLVYAVIKTESSYNENAESNVGARGLMQIMEETFDWIKFRLGDDDSVTFDDMYNAETNIRYGTYLLGYLLNYFEGETDVAMAAYHAGVGNVTSWLEDNEYSDDGKTLKEIPISDTAHYVDKINNALAIYKELYQNGGK